MIDDAKLDELLGLAEKACAVRPCTAEDWLPEEVAFYEVATPETIRALVEALKAAHAREDAIRNLSTWTTYHCPNNDVRRDTLREVLDALGDD